MRDADHTPRSGVSPTRAVRVPRLCVSVNTKKRPPPGQTYGGAISVLENGVRESRWHMIV